MNKKTLSCNDCDFESPEECYNDSDYWWEYYCNKNGKLIERDEGELIPDWCPLLSENMERNEQKNNIPKD